jgi:hypothetical protein
VGFAHEYTAEANVLDSTCQNCHGPLQADISATNDAYLTHAYATTDNPTARTSRLMMDNAEIAQLGHVLGAATSADGTALKASDVRKERTQLCSTCHTGKGNTNKLRDVKCDTVWKQHLTQGRVSESVWEDVSMDQTSSLCGW